MNVLVEEIKKAVEFWQGCADLGVIGNDPPPEFIKDLAIRIEQQTGEHFNFETGKWSHIVNLPWTYASNGTICCVVDSKGWIIAEHLRKLDAELIVRKANRPAYQSEAT